MLTFPPFLPVTDYIDIYISNMRVTDEGRRSRGDEDEGRGGRADEDEGRESRDEDEGRGSRGDEDEGRGKEPFRTFPLLLPVTDCLCFDLFSRYCLLLTTCVLTFPLLLPVTDHLCVDLSSVTASVTDYLRVAFSPIADGRAAVPGPVAAFNQRGPAAARPGWQLSLQSRGMGALQNGQYQSPVLV